MARTSMTEPQRIEVSDLPSAPSSGHATTAEFLTARTACSSTSTVNCSGGGATASGSSAGGAASRRMMAWKWIAPRRWYSPTFTIRGFTSESSFLWLTPMTVASSREKYVQVRCHSAGAIAFQITCPSWSKHEGQSGVPIAGSPSACLTEHPTRTPCGQTLDLSRDRQGSVLDPFTRRTCTAPKDGAVNVAKTLGWDSTESGMPLPPRSPAATRWKASRRYQLAQDRHRDARRLPQATSSTSSGSPSVL